MGSPPLTTVNRDSQSEPAGNPIVWSDFKTNLVVMLVTFVVGIGLMGLKFLGLLDYRLICNSL